jgi:hypothetical protein
MQIKGTNRETRNVYGRAGKNGEESAVSWKHQRMTDDKT